MNRIITFLLLVFVLQSNVHAQAKPDFELWQLASQVNKIGNSYVFRTAEGKIAVMDGGVDLDIPNLIPLVYSKRLTLIARSSS